MPSQSFQAHWLPHPVGKVTVVSGLLFSCSLPLEGMKRKIMRNLRTLEQEGMVNSSNDYQEIINAIAKVFKSSQFNSKLCPWTVEVDFFPSFNAPPSRV